MDDRPRDKPIGKWDFVRPLLDNCPLAIGVLEGPPFQATLINPAAVSIFGLPLEQLLGRTAEELDPQAYRVLGPVIESVYQTGKTETVREVRLTHSDGTVHYVDVTFAALRGPDNRAVALIFQAEETETPNLAEPSPDEERDRLRQVVDVFPEALLIANESGQVNVANAVAREILGIDLASVAIPLSGDSLSHERDVHGTPIFAQDLPLARAISHGETTHGIQLVAFNPLTGQDVPLLMSSAPLRDASGRITGAVAVFQDITPIREFERQRDEWVTVIAHDLKQSVTIIQGYSSYLRRDFDTRSGMEREARLISHIQSATNTLATLIEDLRDASLLDLSRLSIVAKPIDLSELVRNVVERVTTLDPEQIVEVLVPLPVRPVEADATRVEQILVNLLTNAAKYGDRSSPIDVRIEQRSSDVEVVVTNRGEGIAAEEIPALFSRFYRSRRPREQRIPGLGLGLYIAKGLVEAHGGKIWVESIPFNTTSFHLTLPQGPGAT